MKKKMVLISLVVIMIFSMTLMQVNALKGNPPYIPQRYSQDFVISIGSVSARSDEIVDLPVNIEINNGIWGFRFDATFDHSYLTLQEYVPVSSMENSFLITTEITDSLDCIKVQGVCNSHTYDNTTTTGCIGYLRFKIDKNAPSVDGSISATWNPSNMIDVDGNSVSSIVIDGSVNITNENNPPSFMNILTYSIQEYTPDKFTLKTRTGAYGCHRGEIIHIEFRFPYSWPTEEYNNALIDETIHIYYSGNGEEIEKSYIYKTDTYIAAEYEITVYGDIDIGGTALFYEFRPFEIIFSKGSRPKTVPTVPDDLYNVTYSWAEDNSTCTAVGVLKTDETQTVTEEAIVTPVIMKTPTCAENGIQRYFATFSNPNFKAQYIDDQETLQSLDHDYIITYDWSEDGSSCTAIATCKNDASHVATENGFVSTFKTQNPTCTQNGVIRHFAAFSNPVFSVQYKDFAEIPALNHDYTITYDWAEDGSSCTARAVCKRDESHVITEDGIVSSIKIQDATCEENGVTRFFALFSNPIFTSQFADIDNIEALHHDYTITYHWNDDGTSCTATAICKNDPSHVVTEDASISSLVKEEPTWELKGTTTYTAAFHNEIFATQTMDVEDIPVLPYTIGDVNNDGFIDMKDILTLRKEILRSSEILIKKASDVNKDGSIDMKDVLMIRKHIAGMIDLKEL